MSEANKIQIGGGHYSDCGDKLNHWDWVECNGIAFLEGTAAKYTLRHETKGGLEDLKKATHYIEKLIELHDKQIRYNRSFAVANVPQGYTLNDYVKHYKLCGMFKAEFANIMQNWKCRSDLIRALILIDQMALKMRMP